MNIKKARQLILQACELVDRARLLRLLRQCQDKKARADAEERLAEAIEASIQVVETRRGKRPRVTLNRELPFYDKRDDLKQAISDNQVVIVCGETGSGKTTQLPQICIELGLADRGKIGHTQPRRLAARSVSARIAEELHTTPGEAVGYKVRFTDTTSADAYVKLMTDGILLTEIQHDRWLNEYQTLIIDEAHERSLNIDLILGFLKTLLPRRPDLKLIITSATIDPERFSRYFDDAPMVMVSGRTYPVDIRYRPIQDEETRDRDRVEAVMDALEELFKISPEDTLVFFPGERQIREAADRIRKRFHRYQVLPLYARLSNEQQQLIFRQGGRRKIILSTNVAETSLTVPGIRYVIDTGLARLSRYSWRARVQRLPIEKISQASASQRAGRCGRVAPGICIRLYDEEDFNSRDEFTDPEILRTNLASVILQMDSLRAGDIRDFDFIEAPDSRLISDGYRLLRELQAVDRNDRVTRLGRTLARLPIDPRLARMLVAANDNGCLSEVLAVASVLSVQDPRDQSADNRQAAREKFKQWRDDGSDFIGWVNLWNAVEAQKEELSRNQFAKWCKKNYLSFLRVREWQDIHRQVRIQLKELGFRINSGEAAPDSIHRSILMGIPSHIAAFDQDGNYQSTRGRQLAIFPASALAKKTPKWIMAFALIETSRLYAHEVAAISPQWAVDELQHLHQYEYYEPHWQQKKARVGAFRNTRIYGLLVEGGRRVNYARIDPVESRQIFIREALVEGRYRSTVDFIRANRRLLGRVRELEERERRRDLLIGDEQIFDFYDRRLPDSVVDGVSFESWAKKLDAGQIRELTLFEQDVLQGEQAQDAGAYPKNLQLRGQTLKLSYVFDPADEADGVTVWIPLALLNQFDDGDFENLVPGLLGDRVEALIRSLPKQLRRNFIPAPEFAHACLQSLVADQPLLAQLCDELQRMTGVRVEPAQFNPDTIEAHLRMRYCVEQDGVCKAASRSLAELKTQFGGDANARFEAQVRQHDSIAREDLESWDFERLPKQVTIKGGINAFPALVDYQQYVAIELLETASEAAFYHPSGIARLISFELKDALKYCRKNLPDMQQSALMYSSLATLDELFDDIIMASIEDCFLADGLPATREQFQQRVAKRRADFLAVANERARTVHKILTLYREARATIADAGLSEEHRQDCEEQCENLVYAGFVRDIPQPWFNRVPVYLQALKKRLDKMRMDSSQADRALPQIRALWREYLALAEREPGDYRRLQQLRWMIEEFRINLFAQPMKTRQPVSENKIRKLINELQA